MIFQVKMGYNYESLLKVIAFKNGTAVVSNLLQTSEYVSSLLGQDDNDNNTTILFIRDYHIHLSETIIVIGVLLEIQELVKSTSTLPACKKINK